MHPGLPITKISPRSKRNTGERDREREIEKIDIEEKARE